jgi:probable LLM family oxidoreductase
MYLRTLGFGPWTLDLGLTESCLHIPASKELMIKLGLDTFGDVTLDKDGRLVTQAQALRHVVAEGVLADEVGVDAFGVGEHHRPDFAVSAPEVMLAAIAGKTNRILLGSAVTVLSSDDPVRVFQRFSTLDAVSNGRAEVILGRGSFTESYPLFGFDLKQYNELFEERLDLFVKLLEQQPVTWSGKTRSALTNVTVYPPVESGRLRTWVGVGGSPESVVRAARHGLPLTLAIIGGPAKRFLPYVDLYKRALTEYKKELQPIAVHSPGHVAETDEQAKEELRPHYMAMMNRIGRERGWPPRSADDFEREAGPDGALYVGAPETVAAKIVRTVNELGISRFDLKYSNGTLPHDKLMKSIELFGTKVMALVRDAVSEPVAGSR